MRQDNFLAALFPCPLYFILDESLLALHDPLKLTRAVLSAGVRVMQLRVKSMPTRELLTLARKVRALCGKHGALLIVNDRLDIALLAGADGVHLGAEDAPPAEVRRVAPGLLIGATARSPKEAWAAELADADYVGCGSVFASHTKPGLPTIGVAGLARINRRVSIPVVAIGGITLDTCADVLATGVAGLCAVEPFREGDPRRIARALTKLAGR